MASTLIQSVAVALESAGTGFGNVIAASGIPSVTSLSFAMLECDRADFYAGQATPANPRSRVQMKPATVQPEPVAMGAYTKRTGEIVLAYPWRGIGAGTAFATYALLPGFQLVASSMGVHTPTAASVAAATNVSATNFTVGGGDGTKMLDGSLFKGEQLGRVEYSSVTYRNTDDIKHSPALSGTWLDTETVRTCVTCYSALGTANVGSSVAIRIDGDGRRFYAYGCRASKVRFFTQNYMVMCEVTMRASYITDDDDNSSLANPTVATGSIAHALGSYMVMSSATIGTTTPAELARTAIDCVDWEVEYTPTLAEQGRSNDIIGYANLEPTGYTATATLRNLTPNSTFPTLMRSKDQRSLLIGCGPTGVGNGLALYLPAATAMVDALPKQGPDDREVYEMTFEAGDWNLDFSATAPGDTNFRIGFPS